MFIGHYGDFPGREAVPARGCRCPVLFVAVQLLRRALLPVRARRHREDAHRARFHGRSTLTTFSSCRTRTACSARSCGRPRSAAGFFLLARGRCSSSAPLARPGARGRRGLLPLRPRRARAHPRPASWDSGAGSPKIGLGLWNHRAATIAAELAVLFAGGHDLPRAPRAPAAVARRVVDRRPSASLSSRRPSPHPSCPIPSERPPPSPSRPSFSTRPWPWPPGTSTVAACRTPDGCLAPPAPLSRGASCAAAATTRRGE